MVSLGLGVGLGLELGLGLGFEYDVDRLRRPSLRVHQLSGATW